MIENISYRKNVNQQLAGASFQLSLLQDQSITLSLLQQSSCRQAALHHLYTSISFYINEVLAIYKLELVDVFTGSLEILFSTNALKKYSIIEFNELQQWYEKESSLFSYLIALDKKLQASDKVCPPEKVEQNNIIIAVATNDILDLLGDTQKVVMLKSEICSLIDRQRESLIEN